MKIALYSPYLPDHFGGGEKYLLDTALVYAQKHEVTVAVSQSRLNEDLTNVKRRYERFLGRDLAGLKFVATPLGGLGQRWRKLAWTSGFDCLYFVTDGSAFWSLAGRNIMHIQVPLTLRAKKGWEKMKFDHCRVINTNSVFTKKVVEKYWGVKVDLVCQPGIDIDQLSRVQLSKEKIILNVGRFFDQLHTKNQDSLVEFFAHLRTKSPQLLADWQLVLVGQVESETYLQRVRALAAGLPVKIETNCSRAKLIDYYRRAAIYWHATGWQEDELRHPEKMEHFGISTVEAMAAGAVPIVIAKGGQKEILGQKLKDLGWLTPADCYRLTRKFIQNESQRQAYEKLVRERAVKFGPDNFAKRCWQMLEM